MRTRCVSSNPPSSLRTSQTYLFITQIGEFATDYIEVRRDYDDWTPPAAVEKSWKASNGYESDTTRDTPIVAAGDRHGRPDLGPGHPTPNAPAPGTTPPLDIIAEKRE